MILSFGLNKALKEGKYKSAIPVKPTDKYEVGQWYWCGYWQQAYKVTHVEYKTAQGKQLLEEVTVKWDDGKYTTHCTQLDPRHDYKLYKEDKVNE